MDDEINTVTTPGSRIGGRIARLAADAVAHTQQQLARTKQDIGTRVFTEVTNHVSDEVRGMMGPIWRAVEKSPGTTPELRALFHNLGHVRGQAMAWIGGTATSAAMGGGLLNLLTNELNPAVLPLIAANPHGILAPGDAAQAYARGLIGKDFAYDDAHKGGMNDDRMNALIGLARRPPDIAAIMDLRNRGLINDNEAILALRESGLNQRYEADVLKLRHTPLSPADAAAAQSRNLLSPAQVHEVAGQAGVSPADADVLMGLAGEPPSSQDLIFAWRRGIITEQDVDRGIVQGPIRNEWIPVVKALADVPLAPEEAAAAVTQGHLGYSQAEAKARLSGVLPEDFKTIVANAGRPPGVDFAAQAFNRGLIDDAQWERMFLESAIKNEYIPIMRAMRQEILPADTIRLMYRNGVYPFDAALRGLRDHGLSDVDARAALALEDVRKHEGSRDLSATQVIELYRDELITTDQATGMLESAGYDAQETGWRLALAEVDKMRRFVNAAVNRVRAAYVSRQVDDNEAIGLLDQIGIHPTQRDRLINLWELERDVVSAQLTTAQIQSALRKGLIDSDGARDRFLARGFSPADADILVELAGGTPAATQGE